MRIKKISSRREVLAELTRLGLDEDRRHLRCWLGQPAGPIGRGRAILARIRPNTDAWGLVFRAGVLSATGDLTGARIAIEKAARDLPEEAMVRAWRGELALLRGETGAALKELGAAIALDANCAWPYSYRAAARLATDDAAGAQQDLRAVVRLKGHSAAGWALRALLEGRQGDRAQAALWFDEAMKRCREGWVYALRGMLKSEWGDLQGARTDLDRALREEDSAWVRLERARVARRLGQLPLSLRELRKVAKAVPLSAEPHLTSAAMFFDQARFGEALASLDTAIGLQPGRAEIHDQRARVRFVLNDWAGAERDLRRAMHLQPEDKGLKERFVQVLILKDAAARAERFLSEQELRCGARELWLGYLRCRQRRYTTAARLFGLAVKKGEDAEMRRTAIFYRWVARLLGEDGAGSTEKEKGLTILGLGYRHPFQIGAAGLRTLARCETIFSNISDPKVGDFLGLFPVPRRATFFRNSKDQAEQSAREVLACLARKNRVAVVTRGHPTVFGPLALSLVERCKAEEIGCRVIGAAATFDLLPVLADQESSGSEGLQVRDSMDLADVTPCLPLVVYRPNTRKCRGLERMLTRYPRRHPCYLLPGQGERGRIIRVEVGDLREGLDRAGHSCTLYMPAAEAPR